MSALVVGGMVGGGIYVALGVVVEAAGRWAWLSFAIAGVIAVTTAHSYGSLSNHFESSGGAFDFLMKMDRRGAAGSLSWTMIVAYTLTLGLYAFAFGEYVAHAVGVGPLATRVISVLAISLLTGLILLGVDNLKRVEIFIVSANLVVLVILGVVGVSDWSPGSLSPSGDALALWRAGIGAAAIFVSYEGFQLLTYDYGEIDDPKRTLTPTLTWGSFAVVGIYILVALGATMLVGADAVLENETVVLAVAAEQFLGLGGLIAMTVAAAFATSAAINSTLFSTAQLATRIADDGELPAWFDSRNDSGIPARAVIVIAAIAALLSVVGSLTGLVEAASLVFLVAFGAVNIIALRNEAGSSLVASVALAVGGVVGLFLIYRLATTKPIPLGVIVALMLASYFLRPWILRRVPVEGGEGSG